jgi:DNA replication protein DnaC
MSKYELYSSSPVCMHLLEQIYIDLELKNGICLGLDKTETKIYKNKKYLHKSIIPLNGIYKLDDIEIIIEDLIINDSIQMINISKKSYQIIKKLTLNHFNDEIVKKFIDIKYQKFVDFIQQKMLTNSQYILRRIYTKYGWSCFTNYINKRDCNSIFLKENQKENIISNIQKFDSEDSMNDYRKYGIPYKLNILLYGEPGTGKTSLIHSIASLTNRNLCVFNIGNLLPENSISDVFNGLNDIDERCILIIEDIDCICNETHTKEMSCLINCLDGFNHKEGLITFITTNYPEKLTNAFRRAGRIDLDVCLNNLDKYQIKSMLQFYFPNDIISEDLIKTIKNKNVAPCILQDFLFRNRKESLTFLNKNINAIDDIVNRISNIPKNIYA